MGSISAWAEEPGPDRRAISRDRVDLRVGGGAFKCSKSAVYNKGRSPRGRRSREYDRNVDALLGSISAWAEEPSTALR